MSGHAYVTFVMGTGDDVSGHDPSAGYVSGALTLALTLRKVRSLFFLFSLSLSYAQI